MFFIEEIFQTFVQINWGPFHYPKLEIANITLSLEKANRNKNN